MAKEGAMKCLCIALLVFIFFVPCFAGQVYMWKDEKGVPHVSDKPPTGGTAEGLQEYQYEDRNVESSSENTKGLDRLDNKLVVQPEQEWADNEARDRARSEADKEAARNAEYERQRQVELEKNRLKSAINNLKEDRGQSTTTLSSSQKEQMIFYLENQIKKLESNPEQYFYDKQQRDSRPSNLAIDPRTGQVIPVIPFGGK
jgi:hypothetical protein